MMAGVFLTDLTLAAQASSTGFLGLLVPMVAMIAIFYFLVIGPQRRHQKKLDEMRNALKAGDKVITTSGIFGTIVGIEPDSVQLRIADQVRIKVLRSAVAGPQPETKES